MVAVNKSDIPNLAEVSCICVLLFIDFCHYYSRFHKRNTLVVVNLEISLIFLCVHVLSSLHVQQLKESFVEQDFCKYQ